MASWTLLSADERWEYWQSGDDVYRRKVSAHNVMSTDGAPLGAHWDSKRWHYDRFVGGEQHA